MSDTNAARRGGRPFRGLLLTRAATTAVMVAERLWPLVLPLLLTFALFAILSWFGLFRPMPEWLRLGTLGLFAAALFGSLAFVARFRRPSDEEIDHRIEAENELEHEPLSVQSDRLAGSHADPFTEALWAEHRRRMAARLHDLRSGAPRTSVPARDPWALRAIVALLFVVALAYSTGPLGGSLGDAFVPHGGAGRIPARVDAWATPPAYTGRAPVYLTSRAARDGTDFAVPTGSRLTVHVVGASGLERLLQTDPGGKTADIAPERAGKSEAADEAAPEQRTADFELDLDHDGTVELADGGVTLGRWRFSVIPDRPPTIAFAGDPTHALNGTLQLAYRADDDYGITAARAEIVPLAKPGPHAHPLYGAPKVPLALPRPGATGDTRTEIDLTAHPWAGSQVEMTLVATDAAGHEARSETKTLVLPERPFSNPLARAVVEQRRILALDANRKDHVLDMLDAITLHPEDTIKDPGRYLALRSARTRLALAQTDDQLRDVVAYMWTIARGIEDGELSAAEQRLRQAQEALRQAIRTAPATRRSRA